jgi:hypothetical protein
LTESRNRRSSAGVASAWVDEIISLEGAVADTEARLEDLYRRALRQERESIIQFLENRSFVRGVALASPDVAHNLARLNGREPDSFGRREKRLCLTLLRYASRAALKLSPFSTLTRTGLGLVTDDAPADFVFMPGDAWKEKSTVAFRRELLAQCSCLLLRCPAFAESLEVALNETLAIDGDGICSLLRPDRWEFDDESHAFRYCEPSLIRAQLDGPLVPWLIAELREEPRIYRHLVARARAAFDPEEGDLIVQGIGGLLDVGFLNLILPWNFSGPDLERQIVDHLGSLPEDAGLAAVRDRLRELTAILESYSETFYPAIRSLEACTRGVEGLFQALAPSAGLDGRIEFEAYDKTCEEDVFLLPGPDRNGMHDIARLSRARVHALLEDLDPLARLINLHSSVHDLLHTLAAFGESRWSGAKEVGLLDFFSAAQPLFNQYLRYRANLLARPVPLAPGFNPLELESVRSLNRWRARVERELKDCIQDAGSAQRLCSRALDALLDQVPAVPARSCDFCAFVQPLDPDGRQWVLNSINEGFGRLGSRFTSGMDDDTRAYWAASFTPLSFLDLDGEQVELVDMACPGPRTINVHTHQTLRVLTMPGEQSAVASERRLRLNDLRVRMRGADLTPVLTDATGRRLLPVPFGSLAAGGRPTLLKFLAIFGPREFRWQLPTRAPREEDGVQVLDRHLLGQIVYVRKRWTFAPKQLLAMTEGNGEVAAYAAVNRWRLSKGIPDLVFVQEPRALARLKPQYIDFSSPSFIQIFRSILKGATQALTLEEALPVPEQFPVRGYHWAAEVQLESFAFRREFPLVTSERNKLQPVQQA